MEYMLLQPFIQWGFAGFAFLQLAFIAWQAKNQSRLQGQTNKVIAGNTGAVNRMHDGAERQERILGSMRDLLLTRPCFKRGETA